MPREATITYEQVVAAADAIKAEGGKPTMRAVRERLGSGSLGTVQRLLGQWQQGQGRPSEASLTLPPALQRSILDFLGQEMAVQRGSLESSLVEAQTALAELSTESERQTEELGAREQALAASLGEAASLRGKVEQLGIDLEGVRREAAEAVASARIDATREREAAEGLRVELAKASLRLEGLPRLESELARLGAELAEERKARQGAERSAVAAEASLEAGKARLEDLAVMLKDNRQRADDSIARAEADRQRVGGELAAARQEAKDCATKLARLEGVIDQMRQAKATKRTEIDDPSASVPPEGGTVDSHTVV